jgi:protein-S-isoprenylcysteine O-methyltransferase Ste14
MKSSRSVLFAAVVLYFVIALEVLIMISPFAGFFYAAFDPVLLWFAQWPATRWLAAFFLPHMVSPPGLALQATRIAGSVLFVGGTIAFFICAGQVYFNKIFRRGPVIGGLYRWIRHPQYLALAVTGLGLAILWPRFLTIVLWTVMVGLYYLLAKDEERRMLRQFGDQYRQYMTRTGMFIPLGLERVLLQLTPFQAGWLRLLLGFIIVGALAIGGAFVLRAYTISQLPLWTEGRITALAILPGDAIMLEHRMAAILDLPEVRSRLDGISDPILVYLVPPDYVMQGMIADTGPQWRLYQNHQTLAMIADWIFHPFRHLEDGGHVAMHHGAGGALMASASPSAMVRRFIFLRIEAFAPNPGPDADFDISATRLPVFFADIDIPSLSLVDIQSLGPGTGWGRVPTPMF